MTYLLQLLDYPLECITPLKRLITGSLISSRKKLWKTAVCQRGGSRHVSRLHVLVHGNYTLNLRPHSRYRQLSGESPLILFCEQSNFSSRTNGFGLPLQTLSMNSTCSSIVKNCNYEYLLYNQFLFYKIIYCINIKKCLASMKDVY